MVKARHYPDIEDFRVQFVRVLESFYVKQPGIARLLKDEDLSNLTATLLWHCVNDARERLSRAKELRPKAKTEIGRTLAGIEAARFVYSVLDSKPQVLEFLSLLGSDLREKQRRIEQAPRSLDYGRGAVDWGILDYVDTVLSQRLGQPLSNVALEALVISAMKASGQKKVWRGSSGDTVRKGLEDFRARRLAHHQKCLCPETSQPKK